MRRSTRELMTTVVVLLAALGVATSGCRRGEASTGVSAQTLLARIGQGDAPPILDVRTPQEFASSHVPGAMNIPYDLLAQRIGEIADLSDKEVVVYCERGNRAAKATETLRAGGFSAVRHLEGDMSAWRAAALPMEK